MQHMKGIRCLEIVSNPAFLELFFSLWFFTVPRAFGSWTDSFWTSRVHINYSKLRLYEQWQCFASFIYLFKHEISNGCEMAVNFWKLKHDKNFYIESNKKYRRTRICKRFVNSAAGL